MEPIQVVRTQGSCRQSVVGSACARWFPGIVGFAVLSGLGACATIPSKFVRQAEPGVTLTSLTSDPQAYRGKVVILGGVVVTQKQQAGRVWLLVKNRPLDVDYVPHIPASPDQSEASDYWVMLSPESLPKTYKNWSRLTVVGRVSDERPLPDEHGTGKEPVLAAMYLRGWGSSMGGYGLHEETWEETQDASYIISTPLIVKPP
ncbi:MAG: Slp family lipoprotein [Nitrospiraceae bacterium]